MEEGKGGRGRGRKQTAWDDGHVMQGADGALLSCPFETCTVLQINVTSVNSIKKKKKA